MKNKNRKNVEVIQESDTGRNERFIDHSNGNTMTRNQFVNQIQNKNYPDYHIRNINNIDTPVSNPDGKKNNNLG